MVLEDSTLTRWEYIDMINNK
uniref:Uncharacterized protein n=1 Tax=Rhizophora mucronata TaxID=61149 RepID=A0A2P2P3M4_RHIMU